jgi:biopolymer transport protein ExbD
MKIRNPFEESEEYPELTSLIDMMFLLLIFFLLTTSFEQDKSQKTIEVELPLAKNSHPVVNNASVYIGISRSGDFTINNSQYDKQQVFEELKAQISASHDSVVIIYGDRSAPYHAVVYVYDMLQALGVKHFSHQVQ